MQAAQRRVGLNFGIGVDFISGYFLVSSWGSMLSSDAGLFQGLNVGWAPSNILGRTPRNSRPPPTGTCENTQNVN